MLEVTHMAFQTECGMRFAFTPVGDGTNDLELYVAAPGRPATEAEVIDGVRLAAEFVAKLLTRLKTRDRVQYHFPQ